MLADILNVEVDVLLLDTVENLEKRGLFEKGERLYRITAHGVDFLFDQTMDCSPNAVPPIDNSIGFTSLCPECSASLTQGRASQHQHGKPLPEQFRAFLLDILEFPWEHPVENAVRTGATTGLLLDKFDPYQALGLAAMACT